MRIWLFKSYVTAGNDILAKHIEAWAKERNVEAEFDWATFGDREQKFVAAIEAGNPPDVAEMNYQGPMRYKAGAARRDEARQGPRGRARRPSAVRRPRRAVQRPVLRHRPAGLRRRAARPQGPARREGPQDAQGLRPRRDRHGQEGQDASKDLWGFGQTLNRCDDGNGFMQNILWNYGGGAWDKDGKPALATTFRKQNLDGPAVRRRHDPEAQGPAAGRHGLERRQQQRGVHGGQARQHQQRRQPLLRDGRKRKHPLLREDARSS